MSTCRWLFQLAIYSIFSFTSLAAFADAKNEILDTSYLDRIASNSPPLDERERQLYLEERGIFQKRYETLMQWLKNARAYAAFTNLKNAQIQDHPELWQVLSKKNVSSEGYDRFFAESLLFFKMLRNKQTKASIDDQFLKWREAWLAVDMKLLRTNYAQQWSAALLETFALAFIEAGPWSVEAEARVDRYFDQRPEFKSQPRSKLTSSLFGLAKNTPVPESYLLLVNAVGFLPTLIIAGAGASAILNFAASYLPNLPLAVSAPAMISSFVGAGYLSFRVADILGKWPRSYELLTKRFSVMIGTSPPRCPDLLTLGTTRETK